MCLHLKCILQVKKKTVQVIIKNCITIPYFNAGFENVLQDMRAQILKKKLRFPYKLWKTFFSTLRHITSHKGVVGCALLWAGASQCVFESYFCFNLSTSWWIIVIVEVAQTLASQDIDSTGFLTINRMVSSEPLCVCAAEETGLHWCTCFEKRGGV